MQPGGIATYNRMLYSSFPSIQFTEYPTIDLHGIFKNKKYENVEIREELYGWGSRKIMWGGTYSRKKLKKIYEEHDLVILSHEDPPRKWLKNKKNNINTA